MPLSGLSFAFLLIILKSSSGCRRLPMYKPIAESDYDKSSASAQDISKNPNGYYADYIPNIDDSVTLDPCVQIIAPSQYMVEIMMESVVNGERLCAKDDSANAVSFCGDGQVRYCGAVPKANPTYTFYCDSSCESSDSQFFYRFYIQNSTELVRDPQDWCQDRDASEFPSSLLKLPETVNNVPNNPKDRDTGLGAGIIPSPSLFVTLVSLFTLLLAVL